MAALRFDERVAIVTGAGTGIGAAHARLLAARGARVVVNDLDREAARAIVGEIESDGGVAIAVPADVSQVDDASEIVTAAIETFGRVDVVVNNAGLLRSSPFGELDIDVWDQVIAVNLRGTFLVTRAAWPHLVRQGYGRVVSTTSNSGLLGIPGSTAYASAKAAVWGLTRCLALEASEHGIAVNAVAPMAYTALSAASKLAPEAWRTGEGDAWSRRLDATVVAPVVAWLAHEQCMLNGQVLSAIGGRVARFALRVTEGFDREQLTIEDVRDHEADLLDGDDVGTEYRAAFEEGRAMHRRLLGDRRQPRG